MVARGQFRYHAAIITVQIDLAVQGMGQQTALGIIYGDAGFVAGGLNAENFHRSFLLVHYSVVSMYYGCFLAY